MLHSTDLVGELTGVLSLRNSAAHVGTLFPVEWGAATRVHRGIPLKAHLRIREYWNPSLLLGKIFSLIYKMLVLNMTKP